eukprot:8324620-Alexandrium_andersonii.AAC.1
MWFKTLIRAQELMHDEGVPKSEGEWKRIEDFEKVTCSRKKQAEVKTALQTEFLDKVASDQL